MKIPFQTLFIARAQQLFKQAQIVTWVMLSALVYPVQAEIMTFELDAPTAAEVWLAGEMTGWDKGKKAMRKGDNGRWTIAMDLAPGQWLYKFVVDGKWITDPGKAANDNDGQGGRHSMIFVGDGPWQARPGTTQGEVRSVMLPSKAWGKPVKLNAYLPPGFSSERQYPVLLLLHGSGMDADQWLKTGHIHHYMDNLLADGTIKPFIVLMPSSESINYVGKSEEFITREVPVWLKSLGQAPDARHFAVAGMSMGGFGAFHLPSAHPQLFGFGFAMSGYYPGPYIKQLPSHKKLPFKLMMLCGSEDGLVGTNRAIASALKASGADFYYRENPGAHTFHYWSTYTAEMLGAVSTYFEGGTLPSNAATLVLPKETGTDAALPIEGTEIEPVATLAPRLLGSWRGQWTLLPDGPSGRYEETVTAIHAGSREGTFSVMDAGTESRFDEPYTVETRMVNGRSHFTDPADGADIMTILSEKDGMLWRQWRIKNNGLDVLVRVKKEK